MLCKCDSVTLRRKKFSDFELVDPLLKEETDQIYVAGYLETAEGEKKNVRISSGLFFKEKIGNIIPTLSAGNTYEGITVTSEIYNDKPITLLTINYESDVDFLQINKVANNIYSEINGKQYLCIKLASDIPLGYTFRIYLPNFPFDKGVLLFPSSNLIPAQDEPIEVFYNVQEDTEGQTENDFYFTMIHLADPKSFDEESEIVMKTKVIRVLNIESEE